MKLAIISDTHDHLRLFSKIVHYLNTINIDLLIHCGDWDMPFTLRVLSDSKFPIKTVLGNGDPDIQKFLYQLQNFDTLKNIKIDIQPEMQDFSIDGKRICVFHGDDEAVSKLIIECQLYDLFCTGHTHQFSINKEGKTLVINPGSFVGYTAEKGIQPVNMVIYDTQSSTTETINVEELP